MPYFVIQKIMDALNTCGKSLQGSKVLVLGMAYKKDVDDKRESPSMELIKILKQKGAKVAYNDPFIPVAISPRKGFTMSSTKLTEKSIRNYDCVLIATDHSAYDYRWIVKNSKLVVDTRNATAGIRSRKIVKA
jgi:UDP-N-acetyl-D-glucosamine dehydrogenase